jgi:para-nitrobenzyl esterase
MNIFKIGAAFLLSLGCLSPVSAQSAGPLVDAPAGTLEGTQTGDIAAFKGIPYAIPPIGARRWRPAQPMPRWSGVRKAMAFGPACLQPQNKLGNVYAPKTPLPTSEDCLTLNIWMPKNATRAPVFFWIHGGALATGSSREDIYDGQRLAERGMIVVSINYRLGVLGFMAHPELSAESSVHVSGNYGLLDQIAALRWVHQNIGAFGGDPKNVTIAGESAGALSVMYLMTSPVARGLFEKAIVESGYMITMPALKTSVFGMPSGEAAGQMLQAGLQARDLADLRAMDGRAITNLAARAGFAPWGVIDGVVLPDQMVTIFDEKRQAPVPLLVGFNQGEIRSLRFLAPKAPDSAEKYEAIIRERYGVLADRFLKLYPASDYRESILATTRDVLYGWTAERLARSQTAIGQNAYLYLFDHGYPAMDAAGLHAFHASELPFVFGTFDRVGPNWPKIPDTADERSLSAAMLDYWSSFAVTGSPRASAAQAWPAYGELRAFMRFADVPQPRTGLMPDMFELNELVMCQRKSNGKQPWGFNVGVAAPKLDGASCPASR